MTNRVLIHLILITALAIPAAAQQVRDDIPELQGIDVDEQLGDTIPMNLPFVDDHGREVMLSDYFGDDKPVIVILGYYRCPMLCNLVFNGLTTAIPNVELAMGDDYRIVTVSINPEETPELAAAKKESYINELGASASADDWAFLTGDSSDVAALADALGFQYYYVEERDEYAHPAVLHLLTDDGVISRYLYGIAFNPRDMKLGLMEASQGKIGNTLDRVILYCFHYDPDAGSYTIFARNVMMLGGALTVILLGGFLMFLWIRERYKKSHQPSKSQHRVTVG